MLNVECQELIKNETESTYKFTDALKGDEPFEVKTRKFKRNLNQTIRQCFKKVRVQNKPRKTELSQQLELWSKLKIFIKNSDCEKARKSAQLRFNKLDKIIEAKCSDQNAKIVEDYVQNLTAGGKFSQSGMWKLKQKLHPQQNDPPMAKYDEGGNLITAPPLLRKLYLDTYVHRLRHREMQTDLIDVYKLKTTLWNYRFELLKLKKSENWKSEELEKVLKHLKNNKSRDPEGYINELFKPNICGSNLKYGLLDLANGINANLAFPSYMHEANITTIYKSKGSRLFLENDRGIFSTSLLKRIIDRLCYNDKYEEIDGGMSDSNIGGRRGKNIKITSL